MNYATRNGQIALQEPQMNRKLFNPQDVQVVGNVQRKLLVHNYSHYHPQVAAAVVPAPMASQGLAPVPAAPAPVPVPIAVPMAVGRERRANAGQNRALAFWAR